MSVFCLCNPVNSVFRNEESLKQQVSIRHGSNIIILIRRIGNLFAKFYSASLVDFVWWAVREMVWAWSEREVKRSLFQWFLHGSVRWVANSRRSSRKHYSPSSSQLRKQIQTGFHRVLCNLLRLGSVWCFWVSLTISKSDISHLYSQVGWRGWLSQIINLENVMASCLEGWNGNLTNAINGTYFSSEVVSASEPPITIESWFKSRI